MVNAIIQTLATLLSLVQPDLTKAQSEVVLSVVWFGLLKGYSVANMEWIVGQSWLESARMTNPNAQSYNNPFGMSKVVTRETTQIGYIELSDGNTFGTYTDITSATKDRFLWDRYFECDEYRRLPEYGTRVSKKYHESTAYNIAVANVSVKGVRTSLLLVLGIIPSTYLILKSIS